MIKVISTQSRKKPKTKMAKLRMLSKFVELVVVEVFSNHIYEFAGHIYRQSDGGLIGLSLSGAVGRAVMALWDREVGQLCSRNGLRIWFRARYVDDCNIMMESWRRGWRWNGEEMEWRLSWKLEEDAMDEKTDTRCWRQWRIIVNSI